MKTKYNGQLDCLKFVMACIIMLMHTWKEFDDSSFLKMGGYGVEVFFAISGVFMCASAAKAAERKEQQSLGRETADFLFRKIKKVLFPYLVCYGMYFVMWMDTKGQFLLMEEGKRALINRILCMLPNFLLLSQTGILAGKTLVNISWYVSAMLIAMLLLYPLVRKFRQSFCLIAAPLICLFGTGYLYCEVGQYKRIDEFLLFAPQGLWRAFIGLCLGCIIYEFAAVLRKISFTRFSRVLLSLASLVLFGLFIFVIQYGSKKEGFCINIIVFFWLSILVSKQNAGAGKFDHKVSGLLGEASLYLYFMHAVAKKIILSYIEVSSIKQAAEYMVVLSAVLVGILFVITRVYRKTGPGNFKKVKALFVSDKTE